MAKRPRPAYDRTGKPKKAKPPGWEANEGSKSPGTFKPGVSGNPLGQKCGKWLLIKAVRSELAAVDVQDPEGRTNAELVAYALVKLAKKGDVRAVAELRQFTEIGLRYNTADNWRKRLEELGLSPFETLGLLEDALSQRLESSTRALAALDAEKALGRSSQAFDDAAAFAGDDAGSKVVPT